MPSRRPSAPRRPEPSPPEPSGAPAGASPVRYLERTRHLSINLLFLAPWLLVYLLCWWIAGDAVETQAAASLRDLLRLLGRRGLFVLTLCVSLGLCALVLARLRSAKADARVFPGMLLEGLAYGFLLQGAAWALSRLLPVGRWMGIGLVRPPLSTGQVARLGIAVGAGIFEELLFRGVLCFGLYRALRHVVGADRWSAGLLAVLASAFLFAAYHHFGPGGEPWDATRFTFRFHAGALLGCIFLTRGLGIAAFAHGFYDVLVLLG